MVKFIVLLFIVFSTTTLLSAELVEVNGKESEEFQESAFIKLMSKLNDGEIPYPFSKLLDSFRTGTREVGNVLMVPKGRSLVKENSDFHNPRIIVAPISNINEEFKQANLDRGNGEVHNPAWKDNLQKINQMGINDTDLFIGFAPDHKALEVISYNPKKPGYDFFVIENYEKGKKPRIVNNPALCLGCHQNEGPIFTKFPWHDIIGNTGYKQDEPGFFRMGKDTNRENHLMDLIRKANPNRDNIEGIYFKRNFGVSEASVFDSLVRTGSRNIIKNKACEALCPDRESIECQRSLIKTQLSENSNFELKLHFQNAVKNLEKVNLKSSSIPNRDPMTNKAFMNLVDRADLEKFTVENDGRDGKKLMSTLGNNKSVYDVTFDEGDFSRRVETTTNADYQNPATLRPLNSELALLKLNVSEAKTENEKIKLIAEICIPKNSLEGITPKILNQPKIEIVLKQWPETRNLILALKNAEKDSSTSTAKQSDINIDCDSKNNDPIIPVYKYGSLTPILAKINDEKITKPLALFSKYCIQCHGGLAPFIALPLESAIEMTTYTPRFGTTGVQERIEKKLMPPPFAEFQPTDIERTQMIKMLKELKK